MNILEANGYKLKYEQADEHWLPNFVSLDYPENSQELKASIAKLYPNGEVIVTDNGPDTKVILRFKDPKDMEKLLQSEEVVDKLGKPKALQDQFEELRKSGIGPRVWDGKLCIDLPEGMTEEQAQKMVKNGLTRDNWTSSGVSVMKWNDGRVSIIIAEGQEKYISPEEIKAFKQEYVIEQNINEGLQIQKAENYKARIEEEKEKAIPKYQAPDKDKLHPGLQKTSDDGQYYGEFTQAQVDAMNASLGQKDPNFISPFMRDPLTGKYGVHISQVTPALNTAVAELENTPATPIAKTETAPSAPALAENKEPPKRLTPLEKAMRNIEEAGGAIGAGTRDGKISEKEMENLKAYVKRLEASDNEMDKKILAQIRKDFEVAFNGRELRDWEVEKLVQEGKLEKQAGLDLQQLSWELSPPNERDSISPVEKAKNIAREKNPEWYVPEGEGKRDALNIAIANATGERDFSFYMANDAKGKKLTQLDTEFYQKHKDKIDNVMQENGFEKTKEQKEREAFLAAKEEQAPEAPSREDTREERIIQLQSLAYAKGGNNGYDETIDARELAAPSSLSGENNARKVAKAFDLDGDGIVERSEIGAIQENDLKALGSMFAQHNIKTDFAVGGEGSKVASATAPALTTAPPVQPTPQGVSQFSPAPEAKPSKLDRAEELAEKIRSGEPLHDHEYKEVVGMLGDPSTSLTASQARVKIKEAIVRHAGYSSFAEADSQTEGLIRLLEKELITQEQAKGMAKSLKIDDGDFNKALGEYVSEKTQKEEKNAKEIAESRAELKLDAPAEPPAQTTTRDTTREDQKSLVSDIADALKQANTDKGTIGRGEKQFLTPAEMTTPNAGESFLSAAGGHIDQNKDGVISVDEFERGFAATKKALKSTFGYNESMQAEAAGKIMASVVAEKMDADKDGKITAADFAENVSTAQTKVFVKVHDTDGDGRLNETESQKMKEALRKMGVGDDDIKAMASAANALLNSATIASTGNSYNKGGMAPSTAPKGLSV